ncbi:MAG TPA: hypothetical protein VGI68_17840, partial [Mycobacterium sp.]
MDDMDRRIMALAAEGLSDRQIAREDDGDRHGLRMHGAGSESMVSMSRMCHRAVVSVAGPWPYASSPQPDRS